MSANRIAASAADRLPGILAIAMAMCAGVLVTWHFRDLRAGEALDPYDADRRQAVYLPVQPYVANEEMVGWWASRPIGASEAGEVEYSLARYALVPTLLCGHPDKPVIVTHFDTDRELDAAIHSGKYELVAHVAPGFAVIRSRP